MAHGKPGRPSKGVRVPVQAMVPLALRRAIREQAAQRGMSINDFLGDALAEATGVPYTNQEGLDKTA